jgi:hypothetical protein
MTDESNPPVEIPPPNLSGGWAGDSLSSIEEEHWEDYDEISAQKKWNTLLIHKAFGWIIPIAITLAFVFFTVVLGVYIAHLVLPDSRRWLTPEELKDIHSMLFSGVVGGAIAVAAKAYFFDDDRHT